MRLSLSILGLGLAVASCIPAVPPASRPAPQRPRCDGAIDPAPIGERGAAPFTSQAELATARGHTIYLVASGQLEPLGERIDRYVEGVFGEPLLLCETSAPANPNRVEGDEVVHAHTVLARTPGGFLVSVDLARVSPRAPRVSLFAPADAVTMVVGAFTEARDANARVHALHDPHAPNDRAAPEFWVEVALRQAEDVRANARHIVTELVHGMGTYTRARGFFGGSAAADKTEDGEPWVDRADGTVRAWLEHGVPRGPTRVAYEHVARCAQSDGDDECILATEIVHEPPPAPTGATAGGTLVLHLAPKRLAASTTLEVDHRRVDVTGPQVTVAVAEDGHHSIHADAAGARPFDREVDVEAGATIEVPVMLLPR